MTAGSGIAALARLNNQAPMLPNDNALDYLTFTNGGATSLLNLTNPTPTAPAPLPSKTALTLSANSAAPGQQLTVTATVSGASPTGNVSFISSGTTLGTAAVTNGVAYLPVLLAHDRHLLHNRKLCGRHQQHVQYLQCHSLIDCAGSVDDIPRYLFNECQPESTAQPHRNSHRSQPNRKRHFRFRNHDARNCHRQQRHSNPAILIHGCRDIRGRCELCGRFRKSREHVEFGLCCRDRARFHHLCIALVSNDLRRSVGNHHADHYTHRRLQQHTALLLRHAARRSRLHVYAILADTKRSGGNSRAHRLNNRPGRFRATHSRQRFICHRLGRSRLPRVLSQAHVANESASEAFLCCVAPDRRSVLTFRMQFGLRLQRQSRNTQRSTDNRRDGS